MNSLYRFTSPERFFELVQQQHLTLILPELWPDPYEGFLFRAVESQEGMGKVEEVLKHIISDEGLRKFCLIALTMYKRCRYAQCWTKCQESDALWKMYSHNNKAVRIEIDRRDVSHLDGVTAYDIKYADFLDLEGELRILFAQSANTLSIFSETAFLTKRTQFSDEHEVRLLTKNVIENLLLRKPWKVQAEMWVYEQSHREGRMDDNAFDLQMKRLTRELYPPATVNVSFAQIDGFVRSVMLHPLAPNELDLQIAAFCAEHSLQYLGKSKLYTFEI